MTPLLDRQMMRARDTIYSLSSGAPPSGVAVLRASGADVRKVIENIVGDVPPPRQAVLRSIRDRNDAVIDSGLLLFFAGPHSFTGEDCCEFQVHGSRAVVDALSKRLEELGLRQAEAGEFTRRALENGKMDLVEAEGLADLIAAETEMQRRLAMQQSAGQLSTLYQGWMRDLTRARALIEAELDFPEEEDVPGSVSASVWLTVGRLVGEIDRHLASSRSAEIIRNGFKVVIAGKPNAGKSSLLNALAKRDVAIVTDIPGTTRDVLEVDLNLEGYLVRVVDTAGLRDTDDAVEAEGVRRARFAIRDADLVIHLSEEGNTDASEFCPDTSAEIVHVRSKGDLQPASGSSIGRPELAISVREDRGIDSLTKRILAAIRARVTSASVASARERQQRLLAEALDILRGALSQESLPLELRSESLRQASHVLGRLTGFVDTEDLLNVIFSEFCIGK